MKVEDDQCSESEIVDENKRIYDFFRRKKDVIQSQIN